MAVISMADVGNAIEADILRISQTDLVARIRQCLVPIRCELREWGYGADEQSFACWIFAEAPETNIAFAFCADGFGPANPWGMLSIRGERSSIGPDYYWYATLEGVFRDSPAWDGENPEGYEVE